MTKDRIIEILHHPTKITASDLVGLEAIAKKYPYFHAAHILSAYGSYLLEIPNYESFLQKGILYATREDYFNEYISHRPDLEEEEPIQETVAPQKATEEKPAVQEKQEPARPKKKLLVDNPDYQRKEANHSLFQEVERSIRSLQSSKEKALDYLDTHQGVLPKKEVSSTTEEPSITDDAPSDSQETVKEAVVLDTHTIQESDFSTEEKIELSEELQTNKHEVQEPSMEGLEADTPKEEPLSVLETVPTDTLELVEDSPEDVEEKQEQTVTEEVISEVGEETTSEILAEEQIPLQEAPPTAPVQESVSTTEDHQLTKEEETPTSRRRSRAARREKEIDEEDIEAIIDKKAAFLKSIKARIEAKKATQINEDTETPKASDIKIEEKTNELEEKIKEQQEVSPPVDTGVESPLIEDTVETKEEEEEEEEEGLDEHKKEGSLSYVEVHTIDTDEKEELATTDTPLQHTKEETTLEAVEAEEEHDSETVDNEQQEANEIGFSLGNTVIDEPDDSTSTPNVAAEEGEESTTEGILPKEQAPIVTSLEQEEQSTEEEASASTTIIVPEPPLEIEDYPLENIKPKELAQQKNESEPLEEKTLSSAEEQKESMDRDLMLSYIDTIKKKKVETKEKKAKEKNKKVTQEQANKKQFDIIDEFIKKEKDLTPIRAKEDNTEIKDLSKHSVIEKGGLVSENLATINLKQGKTQKAIKIYEALMLKNPSKKAYFASQIQKIKENI